MLVATFFVKIFFVRFKCHFRRDTLPLIAMNITNFIRDKLCDLTRISHQRTTTYFLTIEEFNDYTKLKIDYLIYSCSGFIHRMKWMFHIGEIVGNCSFVVGFQKWSQQRHPSIVNNNLLIPYKILKLIDSLFSLKIIRKGRSS